MEALIRQLPWSAEAEAHLKSAAAERCLAPLRDEVQRGIAQLWHFKDDTDEAYCITRTDLNPREFVVCYFEGSGLTKFGKVLRDAAHAKGIPMRAHTSQPAVARLIRRLNMKIQEYVLRSDPTCH